MIRPLSTQRLLLPLAAVRLRCLDEQRRPVPGAFASGFLRREEGKLFLYTGWHVVTSFDPYDVRVGLELPKRRFLEIALQDAQKRQEGVAVVGGIQSLVMPLYDSDARPAWLQDDAHVPQADLNAIGLFVPFWHDAVKIELPSEVNLSDLQVVDDSSVARDGMSLLAPGEKCLVVGYPYGFSAFGPEQPTAIALTRFVASNRIAGRRQQFLLESTGAPGMSGGPVFVERDESLWLVGIYTGLIYPDFALEKNEKSTALGAVSNLSLVLLGHLPFVKCPSSAQSPGGAN